MDNILKMAAYVALEIMAHEAIEVAQDWLAEVIDSPDKWAREAEAFQVMTDGPQAYKYERAAAAIYALMGERNAS